MGLTSDATFDLAAIKPASCKILTATGMAGIARRKVRPGAASLSPPGLVFFLLQHALPGVKLGDRRAALQLVQDGTLDPVGFLAFAFGRGVEGLDRAEEAG
jgi:hypothetical protein